MSSKQTAERIERAVINALQGAEEMSGPDLPDYLRLMERIALLCKSRAETARYNAPEQRILRWAREYVHPDARIEQTGGGCTALAIPGDTDTAPVETRSGVAVWYITDENNAPESLLPSADDSFCVGAYDEDGQQLFYALVPTMGSAAFIIKRCKVSPR